MLHKEHTKRSTCRRRGTAHPDGQVQVSQGISVPHARETREDSRDKKGHGVSHTDWCHKITYKGVNVDRKTTWSAESITGIRWRDASGSRTKCSERRTLTEMQRLRPVLRWQGDRHTEVHASGRNRSHGCRHTKVHTSGRNCSQGHRHTEVHACNAGQQRLSAKLRLLSPFTVIKVKLILELIVDLGRSFRGCEDTKVSKDHRISYVNIHKNYETKTCTAHLTIVTCSSRVN